MTIEDMVEGFALIEGRSLSPTYSQMSLTHLRGIVSELPESGMDAPSPTVKQFLMDTAELPGEAIAVMFNGSVTLLVNDSGQLLAFA